ncbi:MAG: N-acetylmuramic acid 6-phosphate etherase [Pseudomonadota bacterium]
MTLVLTEQRNPLSEDLDTKSSLEIVEIINREDGRIAKAIFDAKASIANAIDWAAESFAKGGRLFYVGAGTSGRLGVLDAAECPPTFGVEPTQVQALIAGGRRTLTRSAEGAEDNAKAGAREIAAKKVTRKDVVIGISAGSTTAYVLGALQEARKRKARTALLTCTPLRDRGDFVDLVITALTGPEILTGSTRMKAGSATKMILNTISTGAMIRSGRTYGNLMVDLRCSNRKLVERGVRIVENVTRIPTVEARSLLKAAGYDVKVALAMQLYALSRAEARKRLKENDGFLRRLVDFTHSKNPRIEAIFFDMDGTIVQYGLPTGFSTWAALGWAYGLFNEMEEWVDHYLSGKLGYEEIWEACAKRLQGQPYAKAYDTLFPCAGSPPYSRGFSECVKMLRPHYRLGIISSGLSMVSQEIRKKLNLDFEISNEIGMARGTFDGGYRVRVPFDRKLDVVRAQADKMKIPLKRICFIGDSPNDVEVLKAVGFPVAYNPKTPEVATAAKGAVIGDFLQLPRLLETF